MPQPIEPIEPVASETVGHGFINGKPWTLRSVVFERPKPEKPN